MFKRRALMQSFPSTKKYVYGVSTHVLHNVNLMHSMLTRHISKEPGTLAGEMCHAGLETYFRLNITTNCVDREKVCGEEHIFLVLRQISFHLHPPLL